MELVSTMEINGEEREIADAVARGQIATNAQNIAANTEGIAGLNSNLDGLGYGENGAKNIFKDYDEMGLYSRSSENYNGYPIIYSNKAWDGAYQSDLVLKSGVTYTISAYVKGSGNVFCFESKGISIGESKALTDNFKRVSFTYKPTEDISKIRLENNTTGGLYIACFQIEEGDTATTYKPYIPSVKMLAEENAQQNDSLSVLGKCKNLLKSTLQTTTKNGVTCTNNGDGTYTLNGTAKGQAVFAIPVEKTLKKGTKILGCTNGSSTTYFITYRTGSNWSGKYDYGNGYVLQDDTIINDIAITVRDGQTVSNIIFKPMITTNLNATYDDFVPYTGDGETLTADVAELKNDLGGLAFSVSGTTLSITDGTNTWTLSQ